jgi:VIT1/CCC1 family predicted Fe2+/Mn2+ transporter
MESQHKTKLLLNPLDRAAEILFGLIMALSFTCSISIVTGHSTEIRQLLIGAVGCNLAWGIVDATMYLIGVLANKNRNKMILDAIQNLADEEKAWKHIADILPPVIASISGEEILEQIRNKLIDLPDATGGVRLTFRDIKKAVALFFLIFISTLPVVIPFVLVHDTTLALRISNTVAIAMMFLCGWSVAKYVGFSKWMMSLALVVIGIILVVITIALGG